MPRGAIKIEPEPVKIPAPPRVYVDYHDAFPRAEGPPSIKNNTSEAVLADLGTIAVGMDLGAFRAIWELVEAQAKDRWTMRKSSPSAAAYVRAVESFRAAWAAQSE